MSVFISLTVGLVQRHGFLMCVHLCQRERLDVFVKLIYCSVSEHTFDSLNF